MWTTFPAKLALPVAAAPMPASLISPYGWFRVGSESGRSIDHVYTVFIKASPDRVWRAITDGDDTIRYYYGTRVVSGWQPGSAIRYGYPDGTLAADGEVLAIEPGRSVTMTFHPRWSPKIDAEGPVRMT